MSVQTRPLTYDDLCQLPDDGNRYEIIDGELLVAPSPNLDHQDVAFGLAKFVDRFVREHHLGHTMIAPVDVRLGPQDVVVPDVLFIRRDRLDIISSRRYVMGSPDLAVEIISPSSRRIDQERKFNLYQRSGVPEYWIVDPANRTVHGFRLEGGRYVDIEPDSGRLSSIVIPGLVVDPTALFAELDAMFPDESDEEGVDAPEV